MIYAYVINNEQTIVFKGYIFLYITFWLIRDLQRNQAPFNRSSILQYPIANYE